MKRITAQTEHGDYVFVNGKNVCPNELATYIGEREDLEQELGLDLITTFKALNGSIATRKENGDIQVSWFCHKLGKLVKKPVDIVSDKLVEEYCILRGDDDFLLKDYGKTWALTSEELEQEEISLEEKTKRDFYKAVDTVKWWLKHNCGCMDATITVQKKDGDITADFEWDIMADKER